MSGSAGGTRVAYSEAQLPRYHYGWAPLASVRTAPGS